MICALQGYILRGAAYRQITVSALIIGYTYERRRSVKYTDDLSPLGGHTLVIQFALLGLAESNQISKPMSEQSKISEDEKMENLETRDVTADSTFVLGNALRDLSSVAAVEEGLVPRSAAWRNADSVNTDQHWNTVESWAQS